MTRIVCGSELRRVNGARPLWNKKTATYLPIVSAVGEVAVSLLIFQSGGTVTAAER